MPEISRDALDLIEQHPWDETIPRLVLHASRKMKKLFWQGIFGGPAPRGQEAKDLVMDCIITVIEGERSWDPAGYPDLYLFLKSVLDSKINHLAEGWENRHFFSEAALSGREGESGERPAFLNTIACQNPGPEALLLLKEREQLGERFIWAFYEELNECPMLQKMLECVLEGCFKRAEIAERMGVPVKEFDNLKKQIRRRLKSFQEQGPGGWK